MEADAVDADTLKEPGEPRSSARILAAIKKAEREMSAYHDLCDRIDAVYAKDGKLDGDWIDPEYDLFWASMEIMKPAVYAKPPVPVVTPQFKDRRPLHNVTAELMERTAISSFERGDFDAVMLNVRDDLIFYNRGQVWLTYETDQKGGGQRVCYEHLDRKDFGHELARKWADVTFAWRVAWMTKAEMRKRFQKTSGDAYKDAKPAKRSDAVDRDSEGLTGKCPVYEVWHKADNRVYWVTDGVPVLLDEGEPHLKLSGFFPCPRPAYGTLKPRSLTPVPDYVRYAAHLAKINTLTARIYLLLDKVKMKGLIPAGGDIGDAVEQAMRDEDDQLLIPVPGAALMAGAATGFVAWMPLKELAEAIQGLIAARAQLFEDFYQLSGIADIMRGATDPDETLGAQQLKSQYGSVRVREKIDELQRIARDVTRIAAEIAAEHFSKETLLEMSQMEIPSKADLEKRTAEIEAAAESEIEALTEQVKASVQQAQQQGQQVNPEQAQQQLKQAQQQVLAKYAPQFKEVSDEVPIEDVLKLLRDQKARGFAFEIATDSTIMVDEMQEKASRNEFLTAFTGAANGLMQFAGLGEAGAKMAGEVLRFVLAPYRVGRELDTVVDQFVDAAPQMAQQMAAQGGKGEADAALAEANRKIAEAELGKAHAAIKKVEADTARAQQESAQKAQEFVVKTQQDQQRFALEMEETRGNLAEQSKRIEKIGADIELAFAKLGIEQHKEQRETVKTAADIQGQQQDRALAVQDRQRAAVEGDRNAALSARQQAFSEQQGAKADQRADRAEDRADRQQEFVERQPQK